MYENVVKRRVLHAERGELLAKSGGELDEFGGSLRTVGGKDAIEARRLRLHIGDTAEREKPRLPLVVFAIELDFDYVGPGHALFEFDRRPQSDECAMIIDMIMSTGERKNLRSSRSMMANILFMAVLLDAAAS